MSYSIQLKDPLTGEAIKLREPLHLRQGTYPVGGATRAEVNVTYNYAKHYSSMGPKGLREIYGKTGHESIDILMHTIKLLDNDETEDYWQSTEGNARMALIQLCYFAMLYPEGVWDGD